MIRLLNTTLFIILCSFSAFAQTSGDVFITDDLAIQGYDPVAFFTDKKPVKGSTDFSLDWKGAKWNFASRENLELFKTTPEAYAPQYGGYCAYGMSKGYKAPTQIDTWTIINNKLYFNYNGEVKAEWMKDAKAYIEKADAHWK